MATPKVRNPHHGKPKTVAEKMLDGSYRPERHGEIPAELAEAIFGPKTIPPAKMPKGLGKEGVWLWKFLIANASGVMPGDAVTMEAFCRVWSEYKRIQPIVAKLSPSSKTNEYDRQLNRLMKLTAAVTSYSKDFGLDPQARLKMHSATNVRLANAMHKVKQAEITPPADSAPAAQRDPSDPVRPPRLAAYRPPAEVA